MNTSLNYLKINRLVLSLQLFGALIACSSIGLSFALYNSPTLEPETPDFASGNYSTPKGGTHSAMTEQAQKGQELFANNCASCHHIHKVMVGPALKGLTERRKIEWIVKWVQNPSKIIASKDPYALKLAADYKSAGIMTGFPALQKQDIENIVAYISTEQTRLPYIAMP